MKIVHVYPSSCEYAYPKYLNRSLDQDAFDKEIMCQIYPDDRYLQGLHCLGVDCVFLYPCRFHKPVKEFTHKGGYRIVRCPVTFFEGKLGYEISIPLLKQIKKEKPDIVHFHGIYRNSKCPDMFDITAIFCKLNSVPLIGWYRTQKFPGGRRFPLLYFPKRKLKEVTIKMCAAICSLNHLELERLFNPTHPDYYGIDFSKIAHRLLPNTFDSDLFHPIPRNKAIELTSLDKDKNYILMVSRLFYEKGLHHLIKILPEIIKRYPKARLLLAGEFLEQSADYKILINNLIKDLGIKDYVTFLGRVEHHRGLPYYYNVADVFVLPSYGETFGGVFLEAMACGVPIVTTPVTEAPYLIKKGTGIIVPFKDEERLLEAIIRVLSGEFVKDENETKFTLDQYDYKTAARSLRDWYEAIVSDRKGKYT